MGIKERRERERQETRERILDAARELFVRDGYEAVTMRKIADAIEYSPTAIYLHFPDQETLMRELCASDFLSLAKAFQRIAKEPDPIARLLKVGHAYVDFGVKHPKHYELMFLRPATHGPEEVKDWELRKGNPEEDAWAFLLATVTEAMQKGLLRPEHTDPILVAQSVWAAVHGVVSLYLVRHGDEWLDWRPIRKVTETVLDAMLRGLLREGAPREA